MKTARPLLAAMLLTLVLPTLSGAGSAAIRPAAGEVQKFGKPLAGLAPTALDQVLAKPEDGKTVRLEGTIARVCQNKGCWLELKQGDRGVHVTFEGYSFFVPKDSAGRKVTLEGKLKVQEPKPDEVEHLQSEGAGSAVAAKVSVEATGVEIRPVAK